jgi:hypothetical protein
MIWKIIILLLNLSSTSLSLVPPFSNSSISLLIDPIPLNMPELSFRCITCGIRDPKIASGYILLDQDSQDGETNKVDF